MALVIQVGAHVSAATTIRAARETGIPAKSLMRMFGPRGNPRADNLFAVINRLQKASGIRLGVAAVR
jgi:DNA-binding phage protein